MTDPPVAPSLVLTRLPGRYAVCRLDPDASLPAWTSPSGAPLASITRTTDELTVVLPETVVPPEVRAETGWAALRVVGTLDFALVGILARLTGALADAGISVFALSTYDTDYLLVRDAEIDRAEAALRTVATIASSVSPRPPGTA